MIRLAALALAACLAAPATPAPANAADALAGSEWQPVTLGGEDVPDEVEVFIRFEETEATGSSGCNRFRGGYARSGDDLALGPFASTRMACSGPAGEVERAFFEAVGAVRSAVREGTALTWFDAEGGPLATLRQRDAD